MFRLGGLNGLRILFSSHTKSAYSLNSQLKTQNHSFEHKQNYLESLATDFRKTLKFIMTINPYIAKHFRGWHSELNKIHVAWCIKIQAAVNSH